MQLQDSPYASLSPHVGCSSYSVEYQIVQEVPNEHSVIHIKTTSGEGGRSPYFFVHFKNIEPILLSRGAAGGWVDTHTHTHTHKIQKQKQSHFGQLHRPPVLCRVISQRPLTVYAK